MHRTSTSTLPFLTPSIFAIANNFDAIIQELNGNFRTVPAGLEAAFTASHELTAPLSVEKLAAGQWEVTDGVGKHYAVHKTGANELSASLLGFRITDRHPHPHLQGHDEFLQKLEEQAKATGISPERAKDRIIMRLDLM